MFLNGKNLCQQSTSGHWYLCYVKLSGYSFLSVLIDLCMMHRGCFVRFVLGRGVTVTRRTLDVYIYLHDVFPLLLCFIICGHTSRCCHYNKCILQVLQWVGCGCTSLTKMAEKPKEHQTEHLTLRYNEDSDRLSRDRPKPCLCKRSAITNDTHSPKKYKPRLFYLSFHMRQSPTVNDACTTSEFMLSGRFIAHLIERCGCLIL